MKVQRAYFITAILNLEVIGNAEIRKSLFKLFFCLFIF